MFTEKSIRIKNLQIEEDYRRSKFEHNKKVISTLHILIILTIAAMFSLEYFINKNSTYGIQITRISYIPIGFLFIYLFKKQKTVQGLDMVSLIWLLCVFAYTSILTLCQMPDLLAITMRSIILILITYAFLNISLESQIMFGLTSAIFNLAAILMSPDYNFFSFTVLEIIVIYMISNVMGFYISYNNKTLNRKEYKHLIREKKRKVMLAKAFREIKTLRGILPICSFCHKIRDDEGYWKKVDKYVSDNSHATFTHGVCPSCAEKHYADFLPSAKIHNTQEDKKTIHNSLLLANNSAASIELPKTP